MAAPRDEGTSSADGFSTSSEEFNGRGHVELGKLDVLGATETA